MDQVTPEQRAIMEQINKEHEEKMAKLTALNETIKERTRAHELEAAQLDKVYGNGKLYTDELVATVSDSKVAKVLAAANSDLVIGTSNKEFRKQIKVEAMRLRLSLEDDEPRDWRPDIEAAKKTLAEIKEWRAFIAEELKSADVDKRPVVDFYPPPEKTNMVTLAQVDANAAEFDALWRRVKEIREEGIPWDLTSDERDRVIAGLEKEAAAAEKKMQDAIAAAVDEMRYLE